MSNGLKFVAVGIGGVLAFRGYIEYLLRSCPQENECSSVAPSGGTKEIPTIPTASEVKERNRQIAKKYNENAERTIINNFARYLSDTSTTTVPFYIKISKPPEQCDMKVIQERIEKHIEGKGYKAIFTHRKEPYASKEDIHDVMSVTIMRSDLPSSHLADAPSSETK